MLRRRHSDSSTESSSSLPRRIVRTDNDSSTDFEIMTSNTSHESSSWLSPVIWNILAVETAERFAYFGFRAILVLYFTIELEYDDRQAIAFFAYTTCLAYLSPILGALLADGHFGRYSVILWFGLIYVVGLSILTLGAAWSWELAFKRFLSFSGLFLVCLGTGGIKPCVSSFGADQVALRGRDTATSNANNAPKSESDGLFKRDEVPVVDPREIAPTEQTESGRAEDVRAFFGFFYFAINLGAGNLEVAGTSQQQLSLSHHRVLDSLFHRSRSHSARLRWLWSSLSAPDGVHGHSHHSVCLTSTPIRASQARRAIISGYYLSTVLVALSAKSLVDTVDLSHVSFVATRRLAQSTYFGSEPQ